MKESKQIIALLVFLQIIILSASYALADSRISPKIWSAKWEIGETNREDTSLMYGADFLFPFSKLCFGISFLTGNFTFDNGYYGKFKIDRYDVDLYLDYSFTGSSYRFLNSYFSFLLNYKFVREDCDAYEFERDIDGFGFGLSGNIPVGDILYLYFLASYSPWMEAEISPSFYEEEDLSLYNLEISIDCLIQDNTKVSIGWKYQSFDWDKFEEDTLSGYIFRIDFIF